MSAQIAKNAKLLCAIFLISISVALTYTVFEKGVSFALDLIWHDWLHTNQIRLLIIPIIFTFTLVFFWLQHHLDRQEENQEAHGLGNMPKPTLRNFSVVLLIGFFSLIAGASLGPEAILVPACMILGAYISNSLFSSHAKDATTLAGMGIVALFAAFFNSFVVGVLAVLLVTKQTKSKLTSSLLLTATLTAAVTYITLQLIDVRAAITLPAYNWHITLSTLFWSLLLVAGGYITIRLLSALHDRFRHIYTRIVAKPWWMHAAVAAAGLSLLYIAGGPLVQFTGNHSIIPLAEQAPTLGLMGLIWIIIVKAAAIAWSKALGYRGGLIFPSIFLAASLVAIVELYIPGFNGIYGLIAVMVGAFVADSKTGILT